MPLSAIEVFRNKLAKNIRRIREERSLTQQELALRIGYKDKQVVNNYELNGANPTAYNLMLIAKALDVTVDELLRFDE